jgi:hypothetical protein
VRHAGGRLRAPGHPAEENDNEAERNFIGQHPPVPPLFNEEIPDQHDGRQQQDGLLAAAGEQKAQ